MLKFLEKKGVLTTTFFSLIFSTVSSVGSLARSPYAATAGFDDNILKAILFMSSAVTAPESNKQTCGKQFYDLLMKMSKYAISVKYDWQTFIFISVLRVDELNFKP